MKTGQASKKLYNCFFNTITKHRYFYAYLLGKTVHLSVMESLVKYSFSKKVLLENIWKCVAQLQN